DGVLRPAVAERTAPRLRPDPAAVPVEVDRLGGRDAGLGELVAETQFVEFPNGVGEQVDADAERPQPLRRIDDQRLDSGRVQAQGGGETADPRPHDQYAHEPPSVAGAGGAGSGGPA